ncbi:hypothetical protein WICPIJ_001221 [Wickerhamomyces pijperi]|uniref:Uncharacterized protein n=1 Tax=Wickerhamomyces pijperi TaxID=599730 RepID=A0A9P8TQ42_WICPI|nr:hypothetical protein WICPIJ_001221 [Wickerhamomyces pijperi]
MKRPKIPTTFISVTNKYEFPSVIPWARAYAGSQFLVFFVFRESFFDQNKTHHKARSTDKGQHPDSPLIADSGVQTSQHDRKHNPTDRSTNRSNARGYGSLLEEIMGHHNNQRRHVQSGAQPNTNPESQDELVHGLTFGSHE